MSLQHQSLLQLPYLLKMYFFPFSELVSSLKIINISLDGVDSACLRVSYHFGWHALGFSVSANRKKKKLGVQILEQIFSII
jgi:hypothetical protein